MCTTPCTKMLAEGWILFQIIPAHVPFMRKYMHTYIFRPSIAFFSVNLSHCPLKTTFFVAIKHAVSGKNEYSCDVACFRSVRDRQEQHPSCKDYGHEGMFEVSSKCYNW